MNIRAIWKDPDYTYGKQELVNIVQFEWLNGRPAAWVITNQGVILHRYTDELTVIDKEYMS
jgi:hypothetical protein